MASMRECSFCVMNESAGALVFDARGRCNSCRDAHDRLERQYFPDERGRALLEELVKELKVTGAGKPYDCMVGLSGGADSAYLLHLMHVTHGLRVLAVHVDAGWNTQSAVRNIEVMVRKLGIDLHTVVIEWAEMRELQLAFLKAGVLNQDIPQDHAFFATLYQTARDFGISTFISGVNLSTESVQQRGIGHPSLDGRHLNSIFKRFGQGELKTFPRMTLFQYLFQTRVLKQPRIVYPLNWIAYEKKLAMSLLEDKYGWKDYGTKHAESRFTKYYQEVLLPLKIGLDKRRLHLSSLIVSGQISRSSAIEALNTSPLDEKSARRDTRFVAKKLGISVAQLEGLISASVVPHHRFNSDTWMLDALSKVRDVARVFRR